MIQKLTPVLFALAPIFLLIGLGHFLRRKFHVVEQFWAPAERLNYFVFFPALMLTQVSKANLSEFPIGPIALTLIGAVAAGGAIVFFLRLVIKHPGPTFSSIIQGALRPNTYVGVAAASALYGNVGLTITSISIAVLIPLTNVMSVLILMKYGTGNSNSRLGVLKALATNPVITAIYLGAIVNLTGIGLPPVIGPFLNILGNASLPLGLLCVGAGLDLSSARAAHGPLLQSSIIKLVIVPSLTIYFGLLLGLSSTALATVVLFNALPCTPSAYIMARLMGGDHQVAAGIITVQHALAAITMPAILLLGLIR